MDLGSEIGDPEKTYSGSRGQKGTGSRIRIRNTASKLRCTSELTLHITCCAALCNAALHPY
jgi:hypothetical protein